MVLDLTQGLGDFEDYKAWKFPGGELDFNLKKELTEDIEIRVRIDSSDDLILLCIVVDMIRKDYGYIAIKVLMPYMPYQQCDRNFGNNEAFTLKTVCKLLNTLHVDQFVIFDAHSDVAPALLDNCTVVDNSAFIEKTLAQIDYTSLAILSPKKIFKLVNKIGFDGEVLSASKSRDHKTGEITTILPDVSSIINDDILIIDDICLKGTTFINLAKALKATGHVGNIYLAVSHGIFNGGLDELAKYFHTIFTTNSRSQDAHTVKSIYEIL